MSYGLFTRQSASGHGGPSDREITPTTMPDSATDMCDQDIHVTEASFVNNTAGAITIRLRDKQTSPAPLIPDDLSIAAHTQVLFEWPRGALAVGGLSWSASAASSVWARVRGF